MLYSIYCKSNLLTLVLVLKWLISYWDASAAISQSSTSFYLPVINSYFSFYWTRWLTPGTIPLWASKKLSFARIGLDWLAYIILTPMTEPWPIIILHPDWAIVV